jgi:hypothetical protein
MITRKANFKFSLWRERYRWCLLDNKYSYNQVYRFILQGPLREGLALRVEDYPYTSICERELLSSELEWLNLRFNESEERIMNLGLRRGQFDVNKKMLRIFFQMPDLPTE